MVCYPGGDKAQSDKRRFQVSEYWQNCPNTGRKWTRGNRVAARGIRDENVKQLHDRKIQNICSCICDKKNINTIPFKSYIIRFTKCTNTGVYTV